MFKTRVDDVWFLPQSLACSTKLPSLLGQIVATHVRQLDLLEMPPDSFLRIGLRSVAREPLAVNPASRTGGEELLDDATPVDRRSVPDDEQLARDMAQEMAEKAHDVGTPDPMLVHLKVEPLIE